MLPLERKTPNLEDLFGLLSAAAAAILAVIIVATLYYGRDIFVPVALAILLSFVLSPVVSWLQRCRVPRAISAVGVVLLAFATIFGLGSLMATQLNTLAADLPQYQSTMRSKIQSLRGAATGKGTLEKAADMLQGLSKELDKPKDAPGTRPIEAASDLSRTTSPLPVPVEVRQPDPGALESLRSLIAPLVHPLATTFIIVIFVIFILLQREDLRNRLIRLAGSHDLQRTTAALDDAAGRLSRLFLFQLLLNASFGVAIGAGLSTIGVPSAVLWGILAAVLRFVPYIGSVISAAFPLALAAAVDPGWTMLVWTLALFLIVEPFVGHVLEPMIYGHSTGLSPVAVVISATFWTALWGPIGLVLATPLTVCLVVLGRHVERLEFLDIMFGDRPALSPAEMFYQRMLASDPTEAAEKAEEFLKERPLAAYYDEVALKGLHLAQTDVQRGTLELNRQIKIREAVQEFSQDISQQDERDTMASGISTDPETAAAVESVVNAHDPTLPKVEVDNLPEALRERPAVLCVGGRSPLDDAGAIMLTQLFNAQGLQARHEAAESISTSNIVHLDGLGVAIVCLVYLDTDSAAHMRFAVRRLRRSLPRTKLVLCCWSSHSAASNVQALTDASRADFGAENMHQAYLQAYMALGLDLTEQPAIRGVEAARLSA